MKRLFSLFLVGVLVYACQKEISFSEPDKSKTASLSAFFEKNAAPLQRFQANASGTIRFTAAKGTGVRFPDNAFVTMDGTPVTGEVTVEIKEIYTPAEMILNNTPTMSNGLPLVSGGEFFVRVTKNNETLRLAPGKYIQLDLANSAGAATSGMQVFNGDTSTGTVNWIPNTSQTNFVRNDSLFLASLFADSLAWLNCDKFINEPRITYTVNPGNSPAADSTVVFAHITGQRAVFTFPASSNNNFTSESMIAAAATVVGICVVEGKLYYAMVPVTMRNGGSVTLNFAPIEDEALKQKLSALN